jgi:hypothetical protein
VGRNRRSAGRLVDRSATIAVLCKDGAELRESHDGQLKFGASFIGQREVFGMIVRPLGGRWVERLSVS